LDQLPKATVPDVGPIHGRLAFVVAAFAVELVSLFMSPEKTTNG
jgi:hypothetical protein